MERKVTVISTRTQMTTTFKTNATTLGELKEVAAQNGIDFNNMSWFEGHLRAELLDDASPLPTNIPWRGGTTNDLTFMLSDTGKHIKSGGYSRQELYAKIKEYGLMDKCKSSYGKNFTQCTSAQLESLIVVREKVLEQCGRKDVKPVTSTTDDLTSVKEALMILVSTLCKKGTLPNEKYIEIKKLLGYEPEVTMEDEPLSKEDIDEMFDFIK